MSDSTETVHVFSNGTQFMDWDEANCCRCTKGGRWDREERPTRPITCEIQRAIGDAMFSDGTFAPEMAERLGYSGANRERYCWPCSEWEYEVGT